MNTFVVIDVETANADSSSICQIGIAEFQDDSLVKKWSTLINPEAYFDAFNSGLHGIDENTVLEAPTFDQIYPELKKILSGKLVLHHTPFDRNALNRACQEYNLEVLNPQWLDSAAIVRRAWPEFSTKGYGLKDMSQFLNLEFQHHDALEDAIVTGKIVLKACAKTDLYVEDWLKRIKQPIYLYDGSASLKLKGNENGPLNGESLVFTGSLSLPRHDAAIIASNLGCDVKNSVSKKTTILVVGIQTSSKLAGYSKSSKHRKAEELINDGHQIRIISEKDFVDLCNEYKQEPTGSEARPQLESITEKQPQASSPDQNLNSESQIEVVSIPKSHVKDSEREKRRKFGHMAQQIIEDVYSNDPDGYELSDYETYDTVFVELMDITDELTSFVKMKSSLGDLREIIESAIDWIDDDLSEEKPNLPTDILDFVNFTLGRLSQIEKMILAYKSDFQN